RMRAGRRKGARHRGSYRSACRGARAAWGGARVADGQRPDRGLGDRARRARHARAQGRPRRVEAVRGGRVTEALDIRYAKRDGVAIAYATMGGGTRDLVLVPEYFSNLVYDHTDSRL